MRTFLSLLLILTLPILAVPGPYDPAYIKRKWAIQDRVEKNDIPFLIALSCPHPSYYSKYSVENNPTGKHYILFNNKDEQPFVRRFVSYMGTPSTLPDEKWPYYYDEWALLNIYDSEYSWIYDDPTDHFSINRKTLKFTKESGYTSTRPYREWIVTSSEETECKQVDIEEAINHIKTFKSKHKNFHEERSKKAQEGNQI